MGQNVRIESVTKMFGSFKAVDNVSLQIQEGELLTLLGPSGSGKTTLLLLIAGFHQITSGEILIGENPMAFVPPNKRNIGIVFQSYALFPHMTVADNIAFSLKVRGTRKEDIETKVKSSLELVKLSGFETRLPKQLSGGQQQRVALARALVYDPLVLLMDEPLGALDKKLRDYMQLEIKRIQENLNITVIYVTHDQEEALTISDRIAVMNEGRIEQVDIPENLYAKPSSTFVADFIGESNIIAGKVVNQDGNNLIITSEKGLEIPVPAIKGIEVGSKIELVIRPEHIFFSDNGNTSQNQLSGTIEEKIYLGETVKYIVKTTGNQLLTVKKQSTPDILAINKGQSLGLWWNPEDIKIFLA